MSRARASAVVEVGCSARSRADWTRSLLRLSGPGLMASFALAACFGSSNNPPPPQVDSGAVVPDAGAEATMPGLIDAAPEADQAVPLDAGPEAAPVSEAGATIEGGSPDAGNLSCPGDLSSLPYLTGTTTSGPPPAFTGGAIPDGTYALSMYVEYDQGTLNCSQVGPMADAGARMVRGALTVSSGIARLDLQVQSQADRCIVGTYQAFVGDAGTILVIRSGDGGLGALLAYNVSSDGLTVSAGLGGSSCGTGTADGGGGAMGTSTPVATFVRQ